MARESLQLYRSICEVVLKIHLISGRKKSQLNFVKINRILYRGVQTPPLCMISFEFHMIFLSFTNGLSTLQFRRPISEVILKIHLDLV